MQQAARSHPEATNEAREIGEREDVPRIENQLTLEHPGRECFDLVLYEADGRGGKEPRARILLLQVQSTFTYMLERKAHHSPAAARPCSVAAVWPWPW